MNSIIVGLAGVVFSLALPDISVLLNLFEHNNNNNNNFMIITMVILFGTQTVTEQTATGVNSSTLGAGLGPVCG